MRLCYPHDELFWWWDPDTDSEDVKISHTPVSQRLINAYNYTNVYTGDPQVYNFHENSYKLYFGRELVFPMHRSHSHPFQNEAWSRFWCWLVITYKVFFPWSNIQPRITWEDWSSTSPSALSHTIFLERFQWKHYCFLRMHSLTHENWEYLVHVNVFLVCYQMYHVNCQGSQYFRKDSCIRTIQSNGKTS